MSDLTDENDQVEVVRNSKSGMVFILVDDSVTGRFKVINPKGGVISLPDHLFDEDTDFVGKADFVDNFTSEQISALAAYRKQQEEDARLEEARRKRVAEEAKRQPPTPKRVPSRRGSSKPREARGLVSKWSAPRLTFYRHKIEPLGPKQSFQIDVDGQGTFEITKAAFLADFNDVVMNGKYRSEGLFTYAEIPEKALKFKKS